MNIYGKSSITLELRWCCGIVLPLASADEIQEKSRDIISGICEWNECYHNNT